MRAIMYHYVRPGTTNPPFEYYYLDVEDFRRQLDHLEAKYNLISREAFINCINNGQSVPDDATVLTFDDGLVDHYEHVLPELLDRDLWGLFFVPGPLEQDALAVHRVHALLGTTSATEIENRLRRLVGTEDIRSQRSEEFEQMYSESGSNEATTRVKRTLNYFLPYDRLTQVLDELERQLPGGRVEPHELYMTTEQIADLADQGMLVGGHTVQHRVLSRLDSSEQRKEIERSLEYVEDVAGQQPIRSFAYPYGTAETIDETTVETLSNADCDVAFTTEPRHICRSDIKTNPLTLPRLDCNEFPHGTASRY